MSEELRTVAQATIEAHVEQARARGRELDARTVEALVTAEAQRLANLRDPSRPSRPSVGRKEKAQGRTGLRYPPETRALVADLEARGVVASEPPPPPVTVCDCCGDAGILRAPSGRAPSGRRVRDLHPATGQAYERTTGRPGDVVVWCRYCPAELQRSRQLHGLWPLDVEASRLEHFETTRPGQQQALALVRRWLGEEAHPFLVLSGPVGVGKSHLAKGAAVALAERGYGVRFETARGVLDGLKAAYDREGGPPPGEEYRAAGVLVLDDLGAERGTEWALRELEALIFHRYERRMRTLITTNHNLRSLAARADDPFGRLASRLGDVDVVLSQRMAGEDYRRKARSA